MFFLLWNYRFQLTYMHIVIIVSFFFSKFPISVKSLCQNTKILKNFLFNRNSFCASFMCSPLYCVLCSWLNHFLIKTEMIWWHNAHSINSLVPFVNLIFCRSSEVKVSKKNRKMDMQGFFVTKVTKADLTKYGVKWIFPIGSSEILLHYD